MLPCVQLQVCRTHCPLYLLHRLLYKDPRENFGFVILRQPRDKSLRALTVELFNVICPYITSTGSASLPKLQEYVAAGVLKSIFKVLAVQFLIIV